MAHSNVAMGLFFLSFYMLLIKEVTEMRPDKIEASSIELSDNNKFKPLKFGRVQKIKLLSSLCTPSYVHAYSLCIGYMKKWFLDHFPENYFKTIYIEGKHVIDEYKKYNNKELVKRAKPALAIVPSPDLQFDNENLNWKFGDINKYLYRLY